MTTMINPLDQTPAVLARANASEKPLMSGQELWVTLGYPTANAFAQAARRRTTPVPVFSLPGRRGKYALRIDVVTWIADLRQLADSGASHGAAATDLPINAGNFPQLGFDSEGGVL